MPGVLANFCKCRFGWIEDKIVNAGQPLSSLLRIWRGSCTAIRETHHVQCRTILGASKPFEIPDHVHVKILNILLTELTEDRDIHAELEYYIERSMVVRGIDATVEVLHNFEESAKLLRHWFVKNKTQHKTSAKTFIRLSEMSAIPRSSMPSLDDLKDTLDLSEKHAEPAEKYIRWLCTKEQMQKGDLPFLDTAIQQAIARLPEELQEKIEVHIYTKE